jgi:hypothetical protein
MFYLTSPRVSGKTIHPAHFPMLSSIISLF